MSRPQTGESLTLPASKEKYLQHNYSLLQICAILSQFDADNVPLQWVPFTPTKIQIDKKIPAINGQLVPILGEYFFHFQI